MPGDGDSLLDRLAQQANLGDFTTPLTLHLRDLTVSGELVGADEYFGGIQGQLLSESTFGSDKAKEIIPEVVAGTANSEGQAMTGREFLYLKDATIYHAGQMIKVDWWRGRLADVVSISIAKKPASSALR